MVLILLTAMLSLAASSKVMDAKWVSMEVDGRPVDAWVPACTTADSPIILSLHAWATSKDVEKSVDRLPEYAGAECAVIVYPQGKSKAEYLGMVGYSWNAGGCCPNANIDKVDDVTFLDHVITAAAQKFNVNEQLVFVVGVSNGGMMANRFTCSSDKVKALVAVSGPLINGTGDKTETFSCARSVPMLHFHGLADTIIPYDGCHGLVCKAMSDLPGFPPLPWPTVPDTIADWRTRNGISTVAEGSITFKNGTTNCTSWGSVANNVTLCAIGGEGHAWPNKCSAAAIMPGMHCSHDIDASMEALSFFRRYIPATSVIVI